MEGRFEVRGRIPDGSGTGRKKACISAFLLIRG